MIGVSQMPGDTPVRRVGNREASKGLSDDEHLVSR